MLRDKTENQNYGKIQKCRGEILSERLKTTTRTSETQGEFANMPKSQQDDIKDVGGFVGGKVKNGRDNREVSKTEFCLRLTQTLPTAILR